MHKLTPPTAAQPNGTSTAAAAPAERLLRSSVDREWPRRVEATSALPRRRSKPGSTTSSSGGSSSSSSSDGSSSDGTSDSGIVQSSLMKGFTGSSTQQCKIFMKRRLNDELHHHVRVTNSRNGYFYFECKLCGATCAVSKNVSKYKRWQVTICSEHAKLPCTCTRSAETASVTSLPLPSASETASVTLLPHPSSASPAFQCLNCGEHCAEVVTCPGPARHQQCADCFNNALGSILRVNESEKMKVLFNGCKVRCQYCFSAGITSAYDMQTCARFATRTNYDSYTQLCVQRQVSRTQEELEARLFASQRQLEIAKSQNPDATRLGACVCCCIVCIDDLMIFTEHMIVDIGNECVLPRCPNEECKWPLVDFDGCCAIDCLRCGNYYCAWCLTGFGTHGSIACHAHVRSCLFNPPDNQ